MNKKQIKKNKTALGYKDVLEEMTDRMVIETVKKGRHAIKSGVQGIPVERLFRKKMIKR